jgi:hypothetical protein
MSVLALIVLLVLVIAAVPLSGDFPALPRPRFPAAAVLAGAGLLLGASAVLALTGGPGPRWVSGAAAILTVLAAAAGGGPVVIAVLQLADGGRSPADPAGTTATVGGQAQLLPGPADPRMLTGGAWIGVLERIAVTSALLVGLPEGVAVALAVKGLGRYPELRDPTTAAAAAERFIIGTFASVLWAAACAGVGLLLSP